MEKFLLGLITTGKNIWSGYKEAIIIGLLLGAMAGGLVWYIRHQNAKIHDLTVTNQRISDTLAQQVEVNKSNGQTIEDLKKQNAANVTALEADAAQIASLNQQSQQLKDELTHAPASQDGPVAPVLTHLFDELRQLRSKGHTTDPVHTGKK